MKIQELLEAVRKNALYHYTSLAGLKGIIADNVIKASPRRRQIYLTRDIRRKFVPDAMFQDSFGLRLDADLIKRDYGGKLRPQGQMASDIPTDPFASNWFFSAQDRNELAKVKRGETPSGWIIKGHKPEEWLTGQVVARSRWESEEALQLPTLMPITKYVTGLVLAPGGIKADKLSSSDKWTRLAVTLTYVFGKGTMGRQNRDIIFSWLIAHGIPIVFEGHDHDAAQAQQHMINWFRAEKAERDAPDKPSWQVKVFQPDGETLFRTYVTSATTSQKALDQIKSKFSDHAWVFQITPLT